MYFIVDWEFLGGWVGFLFYCIRLLDWVIVFYFRLVFRVGYMFFCCLRRYVFFICMSFISRIFVYRVFLEIFDIVGKGRIYLWSWVKCRLFFRDFKVFFVVSV